ncbi:MAG: response regulator [bacterium]
MLAYPNVLLLAGDEGEAMHLHQLLSPYVSLTCSQTLAALEQLLKNGAYDVLFYVESQPSETWNDVIQEVHKYSPDLPVIILSRTGDEQEWRDVLEAGAFDLLAPPYLERTLVAVLEQAVTSRQARGWHDTGTLLREEAC